MNDLRALRAVFLFLWPLTTFAAGSSLGQTLGAVSAADWIWLAVLSGFSGAVALLHRVRKSYEAVALHELGRATAESYSDHQLIDWRLFALCHMAGALFAGLLAFLGGEWFDLNNYLEAAVIALTAWTGAKGADRLADQLEQARNAVLMRRFNPDDRRGNP